MEKYSDSDILNLFEENAEKAFNILLSQYQKPIYWHIRRMVIHHEDANDITQDTFIKVWQNINQFKKEAKLYTWLYRIATNETINFLNKKKRFLFFSFDTLEKQLSETLEDDNYFNGDAAQLKFQKAILSLPQKQRTVFNMKYFSSLTFEEISSILKTSTGALKASYHHATKKIEKFINNN